MGDMKLVIGEIKNDRITITGVENPTTMLTKMAVELEPREEGLYVGLGDLNDAPDAEGLSKINKGVDEAITKSAAGAEVSSSGRITFKHPVTLIGGRTVKEASATPAVKVHGLNELRTLIDACNSDTLEKSAGGFGDALVTAIQEGKEDGEGLFGFTMPVKLEFGNEAVKKAFMGVGRKAKGDKKKSEKLASAVKTVYRQQLIDMAIKRLTKG